MYILICDDEPVVARQVEQLARQHLEQRGIPVQCAVCTRGEEVLARSDLAQYQLALLDVDLETMTGIALGRRLKQQNPELVLVYISAYLEFAPEGYTVRAFRYLLKRDMERMLPSCLDAVLAEHSRECRTLPIRQGRRETEVPLDQIYYLESDLRKINDAPQAALLLLRQTDGPARLPAGRRFFAGRAQLCGQHAVYPADQQL